MTLVVENGTGDPLANSYASVEQAAAYHSAGMTADEWDLIDPDEQERLLVTATRLLDSTVDWRGYRSVPGQALDWPRGGVAQADLRTGRYLVSYSLFPVDIRNATIELALHLKRRPTAATAAETAAAAGVEEVKLGPISVKMSQTAQTVQAVTTAAATTVLPPEVLALVRDYGNYVSGGVRMARMIR